MSKEKERLVVHVPRRFTLNSWGGTERVLEQTLPLLRTRGYQSAIYTSQALDQDVIGEIAGTPVTRFPYFYPEWPLSSARKLKYDHIGGQTVSPSLARSLTELPDLALVHLHTGSILGAQCLRKARARNVPTVLTLHGGHFAIPPDGRSSDPPATKRAPRRGLRLGRALTLALDARNLVRNVDALICVGVDEYDAARAALPNQRVLFVPGGVNLKEYAQANRARGRALLGLGNERALIVCVARVDHQKDQATLVEAWARHCSVDCDLALIGPETSAGYMDELQALARGAKGKLLMPGGVAPDETPHVYAAADVSVLPSRHEPFGLTCLESWAAGVPLIAADVGGPRWLLRGEREGCLFPVSDAHALGHLLDDLLVQPDRREALVAAGRARVQGEFSWDQRAQKLSDLYDELLDS